MPDVTFQSSQTLTWLGRGDSLSSPANKTPTSGKIEWLGTGDRVEGDSATTEGPSNRPLRNIYDIVDLVRQGLPSEFQYKTVRFANAIDAHASNTNDITSIHLASANLPALFVFNNVNANGNDPVTITIPSGLDDGTRLRLVFTSGINDTRLGTVRLTIFGGGTLVAAGRMPRDLTVVRKDSKWTATPTEESIGGGLAVTIQAGDPTDVEPGALSFDTTRGVLRLYLTTGWVDIGPSADSFVPLGETILGTFDRVSTTLGNNQFRTITQNGENIYIRDGNTVSTQLANIGSGDVVILREVVTNPSNIPEVIAVTVSGAQTDGNVRRLAVEYRSGKSKTDIKASPSKYTISYIESDYDLIGEIDAGQVTSGTFNADRIPNIPVGKIPDLGAAKITSGTFSATQIPDLSADKITSDTFSVNRIPNLGAAKITSGTFSDSLLPNIPVGKIPDLNASKITAGTLDPDRLPSSFSPSSIPDLSADKITSGTLNANRLPTIPVGKIPNLSASKITSGTFSATQIPDLSANKITSDTLATARIPNLSASKITSGTFSATQIPSLNASKITAGTFSATQIPDLSADKITSGTLNANRLPTIPVGKIPNLSASKITSGTFSDSLLPSGLDSRGKHSIWLPAKSWSNKGVGFNESNIASGVDRRFPRYSFSNTEGDEIEFNLPFPTGWDRSAFTFRVYFIPLNNSSGNVVFRMRTVAIGDGDLENAAWGAYRSLSTANNTASDSNSRINISAESGAVAVGHSQNNVFGTPRSSGTGVEDNDLIWLEINRDTTDSYSNTVYFLGARVYFNTDRATDA